jgi:hypothetical protein
VLAEDPDLGIGIEQQELEAARQACLGSELLLARGRWTPSFRRRRVERGFGLLVLSGLLSRRIGIGSRSAAELLGPGDVLRPWDHLTGPGALGVEPDWQVIAPARLALLGPEFARRAARYPSIASNLLDRVMRRSRYSVVNMAIVAEPRVETRLELLFWLLAERWGTVGPEGIRVDLPLTHALLAELVAAARPTVSTALSTLDSQGTIKRQGRRAWLLSGSAPPELVGSVA